MVPVLQVVLGGLEDPGVGGVGTLDVRATEVGHLHVLTSPSHLTGVETSRSQVQILLMPCQVYYAIKAQFKRRHCVILCFGIGAPKVWILNFYAPQDLPVHNIVRSAHARVEYTKLHMDEMISGA